jgi:hypothetical protein
LRWLRRETLVSFVFLTNFAPKASFVTKLCLRPQGHKDGLLVKLTKKVSYLIDMIDTVFLLAAEG